MADLPLQHREGSSSDDEGPEEVPLSVSKAQAAASGSRKTPGSRQRKQTQNARNRQRRDDAVQSTSPEPTGLPETAAEQPEEDSLPEDIIAALTAEHE